MYAHLLVVLIKKLYQSSPPIGSLFFIAILLVSRLEEVAQFAALGAKFSYLIRFTLYQIPYVLPIAIPISCLLSAMLLFQRLSHTHELTALRAGGIGLMKLLIPILYGATLLSLGTFYIVSELATASHLATKRMIHELSSGNPFLLLQNAKIARLQNAFVQLDPIRNGEAARDIVIAVNNPSKNRLNLGLIKEIEMKEGELQAKQVSLISSIPSNVPYDHLMIENQQWSTASAQGAASLLRKWGWQMANDHLKMSVLRIRLRELRNQLESGICSVKRNYNKCCSEIVRRIAVGCCSFTFTLMGALFAWKLGAIAQKRGLASFFF